MLIRLYARHPDGAPMIRDLPWGDLTCPHVAAMRLAGAVGVIEVREWDRAGRVVDRVVVGAAVVDEAGWD